MKGIVFDIKEFAVYDGPGIRTTVFMKGCPLRCQWCHNPEGLSSAPQLMVSHAACVHCGACEKTCPYPGQCVACGKCVAACHRGLRRIVGKEWDSETLAKRLLKDRAILESSNGGVTFSGGEPLLQWNFVRETILRLDGLHTCIETSGYCSDEVFQSMMKTLDFIMMDIKLVDPDAHKRWTGVNNAPIMRHVSMLCNGNKPFVIRLPLIPSVNDMLEHSQVVAKLLQGVPLLQRVEMLPYQKTAGAKYPMMGMDYALRFNPDQAVQLFTAPFTERGIPWKVL